MRKTQLSIARRALLQPNARSQLLGDDEVRRVLASAGYFADRGEFEEAVRRFAGQYVGGGVLSNTEILRAIEDGRITVEPKPLWKATDGEESSFDVDSLTVHLGPRLIELPDVDLEIDPVRNNFKEILRRHGKVIELKPGEPYKLRPGQRVLGQLLEHVTLAAEPRPTFGGPLLCAQLNGLTRNARFFVGVELAPQLHCGDDHAPTLEIFNLNPDPWRLWAPWRTGVVYVLTLGMKIAQVRFCPLVGVPELNGHGGQVRGQQSPCGNGNPQAPTFVNGRDYGGGNNHH